MKQRTAASLRFVIRLVCLASACTLGGTLYAAEKSKPRKPAPLEMEKPAAAQPWQRYGDWPKPKWDEFNTLAALASPAVTVAPKVDFSTAGDAEKGKKLAFDRSRGGSCVACHIMGKDTPSLPGNVGPDLSEIGNSRSDEYLFNYIYDARNSNPDSVMPPWGAHKLFTPDEIKDMVAFLKTLKAPHVISDSNENPASRVVPKETRDNLDPTENSALFSLDRGKELFAQKGANGKSCLACHARPEKTFKTWAAGMPYYEPRMKKVLGVEEFITRHARAASGDDYPMQSDENTALSIYLRNLANGAPIKADAASAGAKQAAERGRALMTRKIGQLNFACEDCHIKAAGHWIRGQWLGESKGQVAHFPTWRTSRGEIWDIRKRFQWCGVAIRANELAPDAAEYGDLELALTAINNGLPLNAPGIRH